MWRIAKTVLIVLAGAIAGTLLSTIPDRDAVAVYGGIMDCETGCSVAAAGWPGAFIVDYPGLSPVGSADLFGLLIGSDRFHPAAFATTLGFWLLVSVTALLAWSRLSRRAL